MFFATVAQLAEQLTRNEQVVRSNRISSSRLAFSEGCKKMCQKFCVIFKNMLTQIWPIYKMFLEK